MKSGGKILKKSLARTLLSVAIALILFLVFINGVKYVFGTEYPFMVVVSNSMYPTLKINDLIVVINVDPKTLKEGDIIVFYHPYNKEDRIVHRIYRVFTTNPPRFMTKGDNNPYPDHWVVTGDLIIGKVIAVIPYIGILPRLFTPPYNYYIILLIILLIFILEFFSEYEYEREEMLDKSLNTELVNTKTYMFIYI